MRSMTPAWNHSPDQAQYAAFGDFSPNSFPLALRCCIESVAFQIVTPHPVIALLSIHRLRSAFFAPFPRPNP